MTTIDDAASATSAAAASKWWLAGNYAPVADEIEATDLTVRGTLPTDLNGRFFRNGPNPLLGESEHWFLGNGMLHGVRLKEGRAEWYRNRYVRTPAYHDPETPFVDEMGNIDRTASAANTHVVAHGGKILALEEGHFPWEVSPDLETVDYVDYGGQLTTAFTAHPKICAETGEMLAFGYGQLPPYLVYYRVAADGTMAQVTEIEVPGPTMMHDFNATRNHVIFMDLPVVFDLEEAIAGRMPFLWSDDYGARLGVMPRDGGADSVRWYDVDPCYVFHPMNAYEDGDDIVIDVARYPDMWKNVSTSFDQDPARLHRWTIHTDTGKVSESTLDDRGIEFPRVADDRVGLAHRYGYAAASAEPGSSSPAGTALVKYDLDTGAGEVHDFGAGRHPGEGVFVPSEGAAAEDDGYVVALVHDDGADRTDLVVLSAQDFGGDEVAVVELPRRVPYGFHGSWIAD